MYNHLIINGLMKTVANYPIPNTFRMKVTCALYVEIEAEEELATLDFASLPQPVMVMGGGSNLLFTKDFPGTVLHYGVSATLGQEGATPVDLVQGTSGRGAILDGGPGPGSVPQNTPEAIMGGPGPGDKKTPRPESGWTWSKEVESLTPKIIRQTIIDIRNAKLPDPAVTGSAGSFFCNPVISREHFERIKETARQDNGPDYQVPHYEVGDQIKVPAAWMIEQCGFKGKRLGGAQVYQNQPLVIVNASGEASPEEIIGLETQVIQAIKSKYGITLHPEVEHI